VLRDTSYFLCIENGHKYFSEADIGLLCIPYIDQIILTQNLYGVQYFIDMKYRLEDLNMNEVEFTTSRLDLLLKEAVYKLKSYDYEEAYQYIVDAGKEDPNAPQPHNLLGIWYECKGMNNYARKHYRVAYVLDPTYVPASENLERVSTLFPYQRIPINYGEVPGEAMSIPDNTGKK
jgi:tetratricopeptide (TPR) repeat protein